MFTWSCLLPLIAIDINVALLIAAYNSKYLHGPDYCRSKQLIGAYLKQMRYDIYLLWKGSDKVEI